MCVPLTLPPLVIVVQIQRILKFKLLLRLWQAPGAEESYCTNNLMLPVRYFVGRLEGVARKDCGSVFTAKKI